MNADVVVVGGGFVGLNTAYRLHRAGLRVVVVGGEAPRKGASWGNAGLIHQGSTTTVPEIMGFWRVVRLALRRGSYISSNPWTALKESRPGGWIWRYARSLRREEIAKRGAILAGFILESKRLWLELIRREGFDAEMLAAGSIEAYFSEVLFSQETSVIAGEVAERGYRVEVLDGEKCRELEPLLRESVVGGVFYADDVWVNPAKTLNSFISTLERIGVRILWEKAEKVREDGDGVSVATQNSHLRGEYAVLAAGAWTEKLLRGLGIKIPLIAGRGYLAVTSPITQRISRPIFYADEKIVISQTQDRNLRFTSYFELNNPDAPVDHSKTARMVQKAKGVLRLPDTPTVVDEWVGSRPCVPDGLPVIGRLGERGRLIVASGLCRLGLTLSPSTALLVEDIIMGRENPALRYFSPTRFS